MLPVLLKCLLSQAAARNVRRRPSRPDIRQKFGKNQNVLQHLNRPLSGRLTSRNIGALGTEPIIRLDPIGEEIEKAAWKGRGLLADIFLQSDQQPPFDMSFDTMKQNGWTVILYPMYETPVQLEGGSKKMAHDLGILTEELEMKWYDAVALFEAFFLPDTIR